MSTPTITMMMRGSIRAQRARCNLTQENVATRMNMLGYAWYKQTVGLVERNQRPLLADELVALAVVLETTPDVLYLPPPDVASVLFGGYSIPAQRLSAVDSSVSWDGDKITVTPPVAASRRRTR
jgi:transcriptional regulator with XRE-family HTH domain